MIKIAALAIATVALLTGCQAPMTPALPQAPKKVSKSQLRRLLSSEASQASLWGVTFTLSHAKGSNRVRKSSYTYSGRYRSWYENIKYDIWNDNAAFSGQDSMLKASLGRYVYTVPQDQVLVLNHAAGKGHVYLNGFGLKVEGANRDVHYLYGPGEQIVLQFSPDFDRNDYEYKSSNRTTYYHPLTLSGFTINPSLIGQPGISLGAAK